MVRELSESRRRRLHWGISARSAFVAATVVFVALGLAGAGMAVVLQRSMLSSLDSAAVERAAAIASVLDASGVSELDDDLLAPDQRIVAVQVIAPDGAVVRKSPSAPDTPMIPVSEIGDGPHVGLPEHPSPYGSIRFSALTVDDGSRGRYIVLVGEGSQAVQETVITVLIVLAAASPVVIAVSAVATYLLVRRSMRSVDEIRSRVAEISSSDLAERVPVPDNRDEISALAVTMNEMLARIEAGHAAQKRFVGDASHELRSPLATIVSALEVAASHPELLDHQLATNTLMPEAQRMQSLVDDLLLLARADEHRLTLCAEDVDLDDLAAGEVERLCHRTRLVIRTALAPTRITGDSGALSRALRNLLDNAARHAATQIEVKVDGDGQYATASVGDDGPGIPAADRRRVMDRFVRLDEDRSRSGGGAGLGLAIVSEIVAAHNGAVSIDDHPGGGTLVTIQLPTANSPESNR